MMDAFPSRRNDLRAEEVILLPTLLFLVGWPQQMDSVYYSAVRLG